MNLFSFAATAWSWISGGTRLWKWMGIGLAALSVVALIVWLGFSRANLQAELARAEADLAAVQTAYDSAQAALVEMKSARAALEAALVEREEEINDINARRAADRARWEEALRDDQYVRSWAGAALPEPVRRLLQ